MEKKRHLFEMQLNSIMDSDNPTKAEVSFVIHGFDISHNYAFISKETAEKTLHSLKGMPIVAKYHDKSSHEESDDALGSHEVQFERDRDNGDPIITMGTVPIGVFTEDAYITTITDDQGNEKEVVCGKGILWASRFPNVIGLLKEWVDKGISVVSSMEILYDSYKVEEGITEILSYVYEGHALLNSQERGNHKKVYPAYDESKLTKLVAEALKQNKEESEEVEQVEENQLNQEEVVEELKNEEPEEVAKGKEAEEVQGEPNVEEQQEDEKPEEAPEENEEVKSLQSELEELKDQVSSLKEANEQLQEKFSKATEKLTQLNSQLEELKPYKEQVETEKFQKQLSEKQDLYRGKFEAMSAVEKFDSEEVQDLIKKSLNSDDEGKEATYQLNSILVDLVQVKTEENDGVIRETSSKRENLIPANDSFEKRYAE
ncbi:hypothetical protein [Metabacillus arenae]|uniref:Uncharacterized protein n=1 Tax=Metabacillus arenae TaxID=2771434 RepID=A0A926N875_9BACI|nr:hypothetical protein [Metabacillus arenae]MBD1379207.1 hypothetical protein [Metabacillus arenae]